MLRWLFGAMLIGDGRACSRSTIAEMLQPRPKSRPRARPASAAAGSAASRPPSRCRPRAAARRRPRAAARTDKRLAAADDVRARGDGRLIADRHHHAGHRRGVRRRDRQARRLREDRGAAFARRLGAGRAGDGPADPREEIRHRGRRRQLLRLVLSAGVRRRRRAPRRRQGGDRRASGLRRVGAGRGAASADGMDSAQRVSAECQRYLREMGIDLAGLGARDGDAEGRAVLFQAATNCLRSSSRPKPAARARSHAPIPDSSYCRANIFPPPERGR